MELKIEIPAKNMHIGQYSNSKNGFHRSSIAILDFIIATRLHVPNDCRTRPIIFGSRYVSGVTLGRDLMKSSTKALS